jgi:hypothetical protein
MRSTGSGNDVRMSEVEGDGDLDVLMLINTSWATEARETIRELVGASYRPLPGILMEL